MVASHLTKDHPQQSICMEEATFYNITTDFISSQKWILLLISRGKNPAMQFSL